MLNKQKETKATNECEHSSPCIRVGYKPKGRERETKGQTKKRRGSTEVAKFLRVAQCRVTCQDTGDLRSAQVHSTPYPHTQPARNMQRTTRAIHTTRTVHERRGARQGARVIVQRAGTQDTSTTALSTQLSLHLNTPILIAFSSLLRVL